jgi:molybdenum cofactor synthesis domain-containing protein
MRVALVTVGDELLSGDTVNTNAAWLGERLADRGVTIERTTVVPDKTADIARVVNEYRADYDAVIVTGGLGPTHDDVTMAGVAAAFGRELVRSEAVLEWLESEGGYAREDLTEGTAHIPEGADPLHNEAGVAPGCVLDSVYVLPGVPDEMKAMFEGIADRFEGTKRYTETVAVDEPESAMLDRLRDLREEFGVKVGSYPGETVRIKVEGTDESVVADAAAWLRERVEAPEE